MQFRGFSAHRAELERQHRRPAKGYGFLVTDDGKDVFVHFSQINSKGHKKLTEGDVIQFDGTDVYSDRSQPGGVLPARSQHSVRIRGTARPALSSSSAQRPAKDGAQGGLTFSNAKCDLDHPGTYDLRSQYP